MSQPSRREFLGQSAVAVGALAAGSGLLAAAERKIKSPTDQVVLGRTGIRTSLIGLGEFRWKVCRIFVWTI